MYKAVVWNPIAGMEDHFLTEGEFCSNPLKAVANGGQKFQDEFYDDMELVQDKWADIIKRAQAKAEPE